MALSGSISTNKYTTSSHGTVGLVLSWTATQSLVNNTTTINWTLKSNGTMSSGYSVQAGPVTVKIAGTTVLNTTSRFSMYGGGSYRKTGTITVAHNQDGTKSVAMSVRAALYAFQVNCTASKTFTLDKISRYALLDTVENFNDEGNPTITYSNPAGDELVTDLKVRLTWDDGASYTSWNNLSAEGGTFTFDLDSYRSALRLASANSKTLTVQYDLQSSLSGTEYHDIKSATMEVVNADPTPGIITYQDVNGSTTAVTGDNQIIVQSQSTLRIHTAASTAQKSATIAGYSLDFNGSTYTPDGSGNVDIVKPNYSGTFAAAITTTDSRGNTAVAVKNITITSWESPTATVTLERVNGFETNTILNADGSISAVQGSVMTITEKHMQQGGSWSSPVTVPDATDYTLNLDNTKEWTVLVSIWDSFTVNDPVTITRTVGKGIPIAFIDVDKSSIGIHGFPDDDNQLYVGGNIKTTGEIAVGDAAGTRANIGIGCTSLLNSPLSSGSTTIDASGYNTLLLIGRGGSSTPSQTLMVPVDYLGSSEQSFSFTHGYESQYTYIYLSISSSTVTIRFGGGNGSLQAVYGVN